MRTTLLASGCIIILIMACNPNVVKTRQAQEPDIIESGGFRDEHGCLPSGGYQWSKALEDCVRLWETGLEMFSTQRPWDIEVSYLIVTPDKSKAEIFYYDEPESVLLHKKDTMWQDERKILILYQFDEGRYQLKSINGAYLYHTEK